MTLDAEYNQPSRKTIEISAAVYDIDTGIQINKIEILVNPGESISPEIVTLTGITDASVANAVNIYDAYVMLKDFQKSCGKVFVNPLVWGSGVSNDSQAIYSEYLAFANNSKLDLLVDTENFMGYRVIDVKSIFQSLQLIRGSTFSGSLEHVCNNVLKIGFEGRPHRALPDAINTYRVWHFLLNKMSDLRFK